VRPGRRGRPWISRWAGRPNSAAAHYDDDRRCKQCADQDRGSRAKTRWQAHAGSLPVGYGPEHDHRSSAGTCASSCEFLDPIMRPTCASQRALHARPGDITHETVAPGASELGHPPYDWRKLRSRPMTWLPESESLRAYLNPDHSARAPAVSRCRPRMAGRAASRLGRNAMQLIQACEEPAPGRLHAAAGRSGRLQLARKG
jgi:hypothetical protein